MSKHCSFCLSKGDQSIVDVKELELDEDDRKFPFVEVLENVLTITDLPVSSDYFVPTLC